MRSCFYWQLYATHVDLRLTIASSVQCKNKTTLASYKTATFHCEHKEQLQLNNKTYQERINKIKIKILGFFQIIVYSNFSLNTN